jgi:hypothetical protein
MDMPETLTASDGVVEINGRKYMTDARGALVPLGTIKAQDKLIDETVRKIMVYAIALSEQIARFKGHTFDDIGSMQALLEQEYGAKAGGAKGNVTLTTFDGLQRVTLKMADLIEFGPELQAAKKLVDECLNDWSADAGDELRMIVNRAFQVDKEGRINRAEIFMLLRAQIDDERWKRAMDAVRDSIRVLGSKAYLTFHCRPSADAAWTGISIDLARV